MEITELRVYRDAAQLQKTVLLGNQKPHFFYVPGDCHPESILVLAGGEILEFIATYTAGSNVEVEFETDAKEVSISWMSPNFTWKPLFKVVESATKTFQTAMDFCVTNSYNGMIHFQKLSLFNAALMNERHGSFHKSRMAMAEMTSSSPQEYTPSLTIGEARVFSIEGMSLLSVGSHTIDGPRNDFKVEGITFVFDLAQEGEQCPVTHLVIRGNPTEETPSGNLVVYQSNSALAGNGRLHDLAPNQKAFVEIARSRQLKAMVVIEKKALEKEAFQQGAIIKKKVKIDITIDNPTKKDFNVTLTHPHSSAMSAIKPDFHFGPLGLMWTIIVKPGGGRVEVSYIETSDRTLA